MHTQYKVVCIIGTNHLIVSITYRLSGMIPMVTYCRAL